MNNIRVGKTKRRRMRHLVFFAITSKQSAKQTISTKCVFVSVVNISGVGNRAIDILKEKELLKKWLHFPNNYGSILLMENKCIS